MTCLRKNRMRIADFLKWWWAKNDEFNRTVGCFIVLWVIPCVISAIWFGKLSLLAIPIGFATVAAGWALYGLFYWLRGLYREFEDNNPTEEVRIIRKIKGIPTPSKQKVYYD